VPDAVAFVIVRPPSEPVYRIARRRYDPFTPRPWCREEPSDRFDDPGGAEDPGARRPVIPVDDRFCMVYCAATPEGALGETMARVRPSLTDTRALRTTTNDPNNSEALDLHNRGLHDPMDQTHGVLLANWRLERQIYSTVLDPSHLFVDFTSAQTVQALRQGLARLATTLGLTDVDFSTVTGPMRRFTQECARYVYEQVDEHAQPRYAGICYQSRLNPKWQCWAIFHDRLRHTPRLPTTILPDDPDLCRVASLFQLSIEVFSGSGEYIRP
jgi:hypothetical protein